MATKAPKKRTIFAIGKNVHIVLKKNSVSTVFLSGEAIKAKVTSQEWDQVNDIVKEVSIVKLGMGIENLATALSAESGKKLRETPIDDKESLYSSVQKDVKGMENTIRVTLSLGAKGGYKRKNRGKKSKKTAQKKTTSKEAKATEKKPKKQAPEKKERKPTEKTLSNIVLRIAGYIYYNSSAGVKAENVEANNAKIQSCKDKYLTVAKQVRPGISEAELKKTLVEETKKQVSNIKTRRETKNLVDQFEEKDASYSSLAQAPLNVSSPKNKLPVCF